MTLVLAFVIMLILVAGMAVGVIFGRQPISGTCGGMKALGMEVSCEICGGDPNQCESEFDGTNASADAGKPLFFPARSPVKNHPAD